MSLKNITIGLNVLLMPLYIGFFARTWTAEEFDVVKFCNTLVCGSNREPFMHPEAPTREFTQLLGLS